MIVDLKLLLDQVGHPGTGSQWSLIAALLGARDQQLLQVLPLLLTEARLTTSTACLPHRGLGLGAILVHPTATDFRARRNCRAISDWLSPRSNICSASKRRLSKDFKIARCSSRVPHIQCGKSIAMECGIQ